MDGLLKVYRIINLSDESLANCNAYVPEQQ